MKKLLEIIFWAVFVIAVLTSCIDENFAPVITQFALNDTTIHVGNQLILEANVQSNHEFIYNWFLNNELKSNEAIFVFTPEKSGEYSLKLIVENKYGTDSIEVKFTVLPKLITIDFEKLQIESNSYWNGSDDSKGFISGIAFFPNFYDQTYMYWEGFSYSNQNDTLTEGYLNQYSTYDPTNYGNKFGIYLTIYNTSPIVFENKQLIKIQSMNICNLTYTALSMLKGDFVAKKFGGKTGNDPDFLKLTISGLDATGQLLSSTDFYLADYRSSDNSEDYIINKWAKIDLTPLGEINQIAFSFESSDNGDWGMNTPAYFCFDNIVYLDPEN